MTANRENISLDRLLERLGTIRSNMQECLGCANKLMSIYGGDPKTASEPDHQDNAPRMQPPLLSHLHEETGNLEAEVIDLHKKLGEILAYLRS